MNSGEEDKVNILLVDDQPAKLLSYEVMLGELGENLIKASTPLEALGILLKHDVAVVLIDVVMPELDGFELAAMIRDHPRFQKLALIFVSAQQIAETDHLRGYELGAVDYVAVPVVPQVLRAKVKIFVDLFRTTRQLRALNIELEERVAARTVELEAQTERLKESEERRSLALSAGDMGSWELNVANGRFRWDDGQCRIFGTDPASFEPTRAHIREMVHPEDREHCALTDVTASDEPLYQREFRVVRTNGEVRWCFGAVAATRDDQGALLRLTGVTVDITERKRAEERQALLAREVDHRAKNTLAVVLSVLRLTEAKSTPEFVAAVEGRVKAIAATHNLLSATQWGGANLRQIVDEEMAPYQVSDRQRIVTEGPPVVLLPAAAQAVALALHELATNAAKYGVLSSAAGRLALRWSVGPEALVLDWAETGGPPAAPPISLGFGLTVVRSSIEGQFEGKVEFDWRPEGLQCTLSIPRAQIVDAPDAPRTASSVAQPDRSAGPRNLAGATLLVVEDEFLVGMLVCKMLRDLGATVVGPRTSLADGLAAAKAQRFDGAVLDFNLAGEAVEPLADLMIGNGTPVMFITGYQRDSIHRRYADIPVLQKPIEAEALERTLVTLLGKSAQLQAAGED